MWEEEREGAEREAEGTEGGEQETEDSVKRW